MRSNGDVHARFVLKVIERFASCLFELEFLLVIYVWVMVWVTVVLWAVVVSLGGSTGREGLSCGFVLGWVVVVPVWVVCSSLSQMFLLHLLYSR